jgi:hypothetical protein
MVRAARRAGDSRWGQRTGRARSALLVAHGVLAAACSEPEPPNPTRAGRAASQVDVAQSPADECQALREAALEPAAAPGFSLCATELVVRRSLRVRTQAEVDALEGCTRIDGDLSVELLPDVETSRLASLAAVTGRLWISAGVCGAAPAEALSGLASIEAVDQLRLYDVPVSDLSALAGLRQVGFPAGGGDVELSLCSELSSLSNMQGWGRLGRVRVFGSPRVESLEALSGLAIEQLNLEAVGIRSLAGLSSLEALGELVLTDNPELTSLSGLGAVAGTLRSLELYSHAALQSLEGLGDLPALQKLTLSRLPRLVSLSGARLPAALDLLQLEGLPSLEDPSTLGQLESVGDLSLVELPVPLGALVPAEVGALRLRGGGFVDLSGLEGVNVRRSLSIRDNPSLRSLAGLGHAALIDLDLQGLPGLTDLGAVRLAPRMRSLFLDGVGLIRSEPLAGIQQVASLMLWQTPLTELDALSSLTEAGEIELFRNALQSVEGLASLRHVGRMTIMDHERLALLPTFAQLEAHPDSPPNVTILSNPALRAGPAFPLLREVDALSVTYNAGLIALGDYPQLAQARVVWITNNDQLARVQLPALAEAGSLVVVANGPISPADLEVLGRLPEAKIGINGTPWPNECLWPNDGACDETYGFCNTGSDLDCRPVEVEAAFAPPAPSPEPPGFSEDWLPTNRGTPSGLQSEATFLDGNCRLGGDSYAGGGCAALEELLPTGCFRVTRGCGLTKVESTSGGFAGTYYWYEGWQQLPVGVGYWSDVGGAGPFARRELACSAIETSCNTCDGPGLRCADVAGGLPPNPPPPPAAPEGCACEVDERGVAHVSLECFCSVYDCPSQASAVETCLLGDPFAAEPPVAVQQGCGDLEVRTGAARYVFDPANGALRSAYAERFGTPVAPCGAVRVEAGEPVGECDAARSCACGIDETSCIGQLWLSLPVAG